MLARFASRAAIYDRENRFFEEDFEELRAAKYLLLPLPSELGGAGMTLPLAVPPLTVGLQLALENRQSWQGGRSGRSKAAQPRRGPASSVCQADFFTGGANSMIFPRCSGETHFKLFRTLFGM